MKSEKPAKINTVVVGGGCGGVPVLVVGGGCGGVPVLVVVDSLLFESF